MFGAQDPVPASGLFGTPAEVPASGLFGAPDTVPAAGLFGARDDAPARLTRLAPLPLAAPVFLAFGPLPLKIKTNYCIQNYLYFSSLT